MQGFKTIYLEETNPSNLNQPWKTLKNQNALIKAAILYYGTIYCGAYYTVIGFKLSNVYQHYIVYSYDGNVFIVTAYGGTWYYARLQNDTVTPFK